MSFQSVLKKIGQDIDKIFQSKYFQEGVQVAETVLGIAVPAVSPLFNATAHAVITAEQNFAAVGKSSGTGAQKLASVVSSAGNIIAQGLKDAGVSNVTQSTVENYISSVVTILNTTPAQATAPSAPPAPAA